MTPKVEPPKDARDLAEVILILGLQKYGGYEADNEEVIDAAEACINIYFKLQQEALLSTLESELPLATSTPEGLDEANSHLDSRSRAYWDAYNRGYCSLSDQVKTAIDKLRLEL